MTSSRLRKLDDRFGLADESLGQLHLRAQREAEQQRTAEAGAAKELSEPESALPVEAWKQLLQIRGR